MKTAPFAALLETIAKTARSIAALSWPLIMASCIALALAITILPLALFLFVVFMAVKLAVNVLTENQRASE